MNTIDMKTLLLLTCILSLSACGGGGSDNSASNYNPVGAGSGGMSNSAASGWVSGQFAPAENFADSCAVPRSGGYGDTQGTMTDENFWIRSFSNDTYLWYSDIVDVDPGTVADRLDYFELMKTNALTPSGNPVDQFHFTYDTEVWEQLSQSGISAGYGFNLALISRSPPRRILVTYNEPNSPAADNSISRGAEIIQVDDTLVEDGSADALNAGLFPSAVGESHSFVIRDLNAVETRTVTLTSTEVTSLAVKNSRTFNVAGSKVGYLTYNDFLGASEVLLINALEQFANSNIDDLIIDMRYNGGGYLAIASELAFMVAGNVASGQVFEEKIFNDKHPSFNPITGDPLQPTLFRTTAAGFSASQGRVLPRLNLPRVFVLATGDTASASEAFINGLRGIDVEVILIGETTRGKPYGFYGIDNCGVTYFTVHFKGQNAKGFGDYADGFIPSDSDDMFGAEVRGCAVADDLTHVLGDPDEAQLATALSFIETGSCPTVSPTSKALRGQSIDPLSEFHGESLRPFPFGRIVQ